MCIIVLGPLGVRVDPQSSEFRAALFLLAVAIGKPRMYMCQEKSITQQDFLDLKSKVDWLEIHGASAMTRKTMWLVGEGCRWLWAPVTCCSGGRVSK